MGIMLTNKGPTIGASQGSPDKARSPTARPGCEIGGQARTGLAGRSRPAAHHSSSDSSRLTYLNGYRQIIGWHIKHNDSIHNASGRWGWNPYEGSWEAALPKARDRASEYSRSSAAHRHQGLTSCAFRQIDDLNAVVDVNLST